MKNKIMTWEKALEVRQSLAQKDQKVAFTNGCFDLLHPGHLRYLSEAKGKADYLIVGLNSDASITSLKGPTRPVCPENVRAEMLAGLWAVDAVIVFDSATPLKLIETLKPDLLIKGGDWALEDIVGRKEVESWGGTVLTIPLAPGFSTSNLIEHIKEKA